jgi:hypothetical protein
MGLQQISRSDGRWKIKTPNYANVFPLLEKPRIFHVPSHGVKHRYFTTLYILDICFTPVVKVTLGFSEFGYHKVGQGASIFHIVVFIVVFFGASVVKIQADDLGLPAFFFGIPLEASIAGSPITIKGQPNGTGIDDKGIVYFAYEGAVGVTNAKNGRSGVNHVAHFAVSGTCIDTYIVGDHGGVDGTDDSAVWPHNLSLEGHFLQIGDMAV